jgi:hypothetical protein
MFFFAFFSFLFRLSPTATGQKNEESPLLALIGLGLGALGLSTRFGVAHRNGRVDSRIAPFDPRVRIQWPDPLPVLFH